MSIKNKVILVTGSINGFGRALVLKLAEVGARIVVFDAADSDLEDKYENVFIFKASFTDADALCGSIERAGAVYGDIDMIVSVSCIDVFKPLVELETWEFEDVIDTYLRTSFILGRELLKVRREKPEAFGRVLNIVTTSFQPPESGREAYCAAKGGINSLTKALAASFADTNVSVNCILAQAVESQMKGDGYADLIAAALYLLDPETKPISGQTVTVDNAIG